MLAYNIIYNYVFISLYTHILLLLFITINCIQAKRIATDSDMCMYKLLLTIIKLLCNNSDIYIYVLYTQCHVRYYQITDCNV